MVERVDEATGIAYKVVTDWKQQPKGAELRPRITLRNAKGDVVTLICRNRMEAIDIYLACGKLGLILAPLSQRLKKPELDDLMARLQPQALIYENQFAELVSSLAVPASSRAPPVVNLNLKSSFRPFPFCRF